MIQEEGVGRERTLPPTKRGTATNKPPHQRHREECSFDDITKTVIKTNDAITNKEKATISPRSNGDAVEFGKQKKARGTPSPGRTLPKLWVPPERRGEETNIYPQRLPVDTSPYRETHKSPGSGFAKGGARGEQLNGSLTQTNTRPARRAKSMWQKVPKPIINLVTKVSKNILSFP